MHAELISSGNGNISSSSSSCFMSGEYPLICDPCILVGKAPVFAFCNIGEIPQNAHCSSGLLPL